MEPDLDELVREMIASGEFHPSGLCLERVLADFKAGLSALRTEGTRVVAHGSVEIRTRVPWYPVYEVRRLYVAPEKRRNGLMREIVEELLRRFTPEMPQRGKENPAFFLITKSPSVMRAVQSLGFRCVTRYEMPNVSEWAKGVGLGRRLPRSATEANPHHSGRRKRWLMVCQYNKAARG